MTNFTTNLALAFHAVDAHRLRAFLTTLGITMGVALLMAVITMVEGANVYVEQKIANLGTNVFQVAKTPFIPTDIEEFFRARRNRDITRDDLAAARDACRSCEAVGAEVATMGRVRYRERELRDQSIYGHTANMSFIGTRTVRAGRYFSDPEERRASPVCLIGDNLAEKFFPGADPLGRTLRVGNQELAVIGVFERLGAVMGRGQDNFLVVPLPVFFRIAGFDQSLVLQAKASGPESVFEQAQDQVRVLMRARRGITGNRKEDFYIGTAETYMELWRQISSAFFAVFLLLSSIAAIVGGIVIMNTMLVSVAERTKEIGVRRACGARQADILRQFLIESVLVCLAGGATGVLLGFAAAGAVRLLADFPAAVKPWSIALGLAFSTGIGLFFGIYPAVKAARLDPIAALRKE